MDECIWRQAISVMLTLSYSNFAAVTDKSVFYLIQINIMCTKDLYSPKIVIRIKLKAEAQKLNLRFDLAVVSC